jgi:hypothetical protein
MEALTQQQTFLAACSHAKRLVPLARPTPKHRDHNAAGNDGVGGQVVPSHGKRPEHGVFVDFAAPAVDAPHAATTPVAGVHYPPQVLSAGLTPENRVDLVKEHRRLPCHQAK